MVVVLLDPIMVNFSPFDPVGSLGGVLSWKSTSVIISALLAKNETFSHNQFSSVSKPISDPSDIIFLVLPSLRDDMSVGSKRTTTNICVRIILTSRFWS